MTPQILAIIVLYNTELCDSNAYSSISSIPESIIGNFEFLLFNNTSEIKIETTTPNFTAINSDKNVMLSGAYNNAWEIAKNKNIDWLLLLDQDTVVNSEYIQSINNFVSNPQDFIAAVPILEQNDKILSPFYYNKHIGPFWQNTFDSKKNKNSCLTAFNSGTLIKTDYITEIGGFLANFPLDYLDYWYFSKMYKDKKNVCVLDSKLKHSLSLSNIAKDMSIDRYKNYLLAERRFVRSQPLSVLPLYKIRLIMRFFKQLFISKSIGHANITLKSLFSYNS